MSETTIPAATPTLTVKLFAGMAAAAGVRHLEIPWPGGTAAELRAAVAAALPSLAGLVARSAVAVDAAYVPDHAAVPRGGSVAIIPPVSGG